MKCYKKMYILLVLVFVSVLIPFNVMAEDTTVPGTGTDIENEGNTDSGNTENNTPTVPDLGNEGGETTTPEIGEGDSGNTDSEDTDREETTTPDEGTTIPDNNETIEEENENIKEETNTEEQEQTTTKRPSYIRPTTIVDNDPKRVEISILGEDKQLLSGIKFQIQDKNGNIFYEEETTTEVFVFEEMELGTYYLVQVSTLDGYEENNEKVEFVVSKDLEVIKVEITNKLETKEEKKDTTKEKDVFAMEAPLLISIAMFDIALVIGVIVYVRKRKSKNKDKK